MSAANLAILPPAWRLQDFERDLALLEAQALTQGRARASGSEIVVEDSDASEIDGLARRLSFAREITAGSRSFPTHQHMLEVAAGGGSRKTTSHALHGLHPYKGKFYPQLARSLLNVAGVTTGSVVLDPFAGCGTTLLEAHLAGARGVGLDLNPMAVLVSRTKLELLEADPHDLERDLAYLKRAPSRRSVPDDPRLSRWFPEENLRFIRRIVSGLPEAPSPLVARTVQVVLSSVLREGSYQDPKQLRIGRRKGEPPTLAPLFWRALASLISELTAMRRAGVLPLFVGARSVALTGDAREAVRVVRTAGITEVDAVITSPPYASALPYIDTDRLSLAAFGLLEHQTQRELEEGLIGNREITERQRRMLEAHFAGTEGPPDWIPHRLRRLLSATTEAAAEPTSGFRRRRTPSLLFAYFRDMRTVLQQIAQLLRPNGVFVLVVGDNTVAGPQGSVEVVPTADLCIELADGEGFRLVHDLSKRLTSYGAPETVHQRNAMTSERVLVFETTRRN